MRYIDLPDFFSEHPWLNIGDIDDDLDIILSLTKEQLLQELGTLIEQGYVSDIVVKGKIENYIEFQDRVPIQDIIHFIRTHFSSHFRGLLVKMDDDEINVVHADLTSWNITSPENGNLEVISYDVIDRMLYLRIV